MIKAAEVVIYDNHDNSISFELTPKQLEAMVKILGLSVENGELKCFSDSSLQKVMDKTINRLKAVD